MKIALETSSIMPLLEVTPRTLPLQQNLKSIIQKNDVEFFTDLYSIKEASQQITTSFENAIRSLEKAIKNASIINTHDTKILSVIFVKSLCENWYGREETLRWSDVIATQKIYGNQNYSNFFPIIKEELQKKKDKYFSLLRINNGVINIDCAGIQSYWATPAYIKELKFDIKVVDNKTSLEEFFLKIQSAINVAYLKETKINDIIDIYHLYSIYKDCGLKEIWSCNQKFVKRHKKYLSLVDEFKDLFDENILKINRIK